MLVDKNSEEYKKGDFAKKHATGKFPVLELDNGEMLFESVAIAMYFARQAPAAGLLGQSPFQTAQVDQWNAWTQTHLIPALIPVIYSVFGHAIVKSEVFAEALKKLKAATKVLDNHLSSRSYLVGDSVTAADITAGMTLVMAYQTVFDSGFRKGFPHVTEWFEKISSLPNVVRRCGYIKMADKPMKAFDPSAKPVEAPKKEEAPKKDEDDLDDLFGDDDDDAEAAKAAAAAAKEAAKKKKKKEAVAMSLVMLEVKPMDDTINLDELAAKIFAEVTQDGLFWKTEYKKEPVAFGIFKLILGFSLEDEKVSVDGVVEKIEEMEDFVQSVEIAAFNKI